MSDAADTAPVTAVPEPGQAVLVRGRPAVVADVRAHQTNGEASHLIEVEYFDEWEFPANDSVLWETEAGAQILREVGLPRIDRRHAPDPPERLTAFLNALSWTSTTRLPGLTGDAGVEVLISPWESAVAVEPYQLYPVLKALEMPRVSLMLADDVGLGKTIEAGLVLRELLARRRIRRVLVICPASLQTQWQEELETKFSLDFTILDRNAIVDIQREYGMDVNPWSVTPRAITSMDFLRQPEVTASFETAATTLQRGHALALDLLIVDEAHNLAPRGFTERSHRAQMLGRVAPHAEHRLFLSATPHNGFTASFSGLLELLDPVRFRQTNEFTDAERDQVDLIMVRRLKSELNERATEAGEPLPFTERIVDGIPFGWTEGEHQLVEAVRDYRRAGQDLLTRLSIRERSVGRFVFSLLIKRLLSSTYAFATTWWRHVEGFEGQRTIEEAEAARSRLESETADDTEKALREEDLVREGAGWLKEHEAELGEARDQVSAALEALGWTREAASGELSPDFAFPPDGKWEAFAADRAWLDEWLREDGEFREDERAILFTEYKDTLDYLLARLAATGLEMPVARSLFGGSSEAARADVKEAFNAPEDPVRILAATDVAAEGLNLQTSSRYVLHWEIPWNPMRMEQRNGRVDRHGQARDVVAFHFFSGEDEDVRFLDYVVAKVNQVREDLGSVGEVIDLTISERFESEQITTDDLDRRIEERLDAAGLSRDIPEPSAPDDERAGATAMEAASRTSEHLGLDPAALRSLLAEALDLEGGALQPIDEATDRLVSIPPAWDRTINRSVRVRRGAAQGALPRLAFDPAALVEDIGGRHIFRERPDVRLIRLSHPLMQRATAALRRRLWEDEAGVARYTIAATQVVEAPTFWIPALLGVINELREPVHSELVHFEAPADSPTFLSSCNPPGDLQRLEDDRLNAWRAWLEDAWDETAPRLRDAIEDSRAALERHAEELFPELLDTQLAEERERYRARLAELAIDDKRREAGLRRARGELEQAEREAAQMSFDPDVRRFHEERLRDLREETEAKELRLLQERRARLRARLQSERDRLLDEVLPRRHSLARCTLTPAAVILLVPPGQTP